MSKLKEAQEIAEVIFVKIKPIQSWSSKSSLRANLVMLGFAVLLEALFFAGWYYLQHSSQENEKIRSQELEWKVSESGYAAAMDAINLCLETSEDARRLRGWYCQIATDLYKRYSISLPPNRAQEVVQRKAYGAMKNDVGNLLRQIEINKVLRAPKSTEDMALNLFANTSFLWGCFAAMVAIDLAFAYWLGLFRIKRKVSQPPNLMY